MNNHFDGILLACLAVDSGREHPAHHSDADFDPYGDDESFGEYDSEMETEGIGDPFTGD